MKEPKNTNEAAGTWPLASFHKGGPPKPAKAPTKRPEPKPPEPERRSLLALLRF